jgi:geranylgeranyl pyrophosphate synthase
MSPALDITKVLKEWRELIHRELVSVGQSSLGDSKSLQAATTYVLQGHGKRLRALLALAICCDVTKGPSTPPLALRPGLALEMLHAASLVHDDLPALDNDDMRRGRPSCHRQFNEATAILTGDYLVGRAFSVVADGSLSPLQQLRVLATLAQAWGDLCMGQQVDIEKPSDPKEILRLMELKTGALFGAAAACGAICSDRDDPGVRRFYEWGKKLGVLFQTLDDIRDGDGIADASFNRDTEIEALRGELRSLHDSPMPISEAVFRLIVGEEA